MDRISGFVHGLANGRVWKSCKEWLAKIPGPGTVQPHREPPDLEPGIPVTQPPILSPLQLQSAQTIQETTKTTEHLTDGAGGDSPTGTVTYSQNSQSSHGPIDTIYDTQSPETPTESSTQNQTLIEATEEETGQDKGPPPLTARYLRVFTYLGENGVTSSGMSLTEDFQLLDAGHGDLDDGHVPWNTPQQQEQEITEPDPKTPTPSEAARDPAEAAKEEAIERLNEREPQVQKARDRVESWSTYNETKLNDFYADKAGGAIETTKTQFDIALFQEQQDATRDLIQAEKEFEQAREEARAHGFIRDVYKLDSNSPEHVDDGYHVSEDAKDIENVDRDRIQKWLDEGEDRPGYSTDCDEWEWKPPDEGDSISVVTEGRERKWIEKWRVICEARAEPEALDEE